MTLKFNVRFKRSSQTVALIEGQREVPSDDLTLQEAVEKVSETEQFLEKLTGLRVHIEQVG